MADVSARSDGVRVPANLSRLNAAASPVKVARSGSGRDCSGMTRPLASTRRSCRMPANSTTATGRQLARVKSVGERPSAARQVERDKGLCVVGGRIAGPAVELAEMMGQGSQAVLVALLGLGIEIGASVAGVAICAIAFDQGGEVARARFQLLVGAVDHVGMELVCGAVAVGEDAGAGVASCHIGFIGGHLSFIPKVSRPGASLMGGGGNRPSLSQILPPRPRTGSFEAELLCARLERSCVGRGQRSIRGRDRSKRSTFIKSAVSAGIFGSVTHCRLGGFE